MNKFNNYKNSINRMEIRRIKRMIIFSTLAFAGGLAGTFACFSVAKLNSSASSSFDEDAMLQGSGGFESTSIPEFDDEKPSLAVSGISSAKTSETPKNTASLSAQPAEGIDENDIIASLFAEETGSGDVESDNLDAASRVLNLDMYTSDEPELSYSTYRVKKGDMIGMIAEKYNITQDTIISVNNIQRSRLIQVGQYLKIPTMPGILYTVKKNGETIENIAAANGISCEKCARVNSVHKNKSLAAGLTIFLPDAQLDWVTRQEINGDLFIKPLRARFWISSPFGWRNSPFTGKRSYHSGIDMASGMNTPVYAALGGKVTSTGFNNVYGNYIIVTHHSGYKSLYAHLNKILVTAGTYVDTNKMIGRVGSTGMSTGPHLHFTVYKFGKAVNPAALWK